MPRRVDATEHRLEQVAQRVPLRFSLHSGRSIPPVGSGMVAFWKDTSRADKPVGKIVLRIGRDRFVFSSAREQKSVGGGEVLVREADLYSGFLGEKLAVNDPLTKSVAASSSDPGDVLTLGLDPSKLDHGALAGLGDDDHAQYLLLAGRSGGQEAWGGTGDNDSLILHATSGSVPGKIWLAPGFDERVVLGPWEYTPKSWADRYYDGRYFINGRDKEGPYDTDILLRVYQRTLADGSEPFALAVLQAIESASTCNASILQAQFNSDRHVSLARAVLAYTSTAYTFSPTCDLAIGVTAFVESSNHGHFAEARSFHAQGHAYGSSTTDLYTGLLVETPDKHSGASIGTVRGIHVGDMVAPVGTAADAILVDAQDTKFDAASGNLRMAGGNWNTGHVQLGSVHLWATADSFRVGLDAPAGETDGDFALLSGTADFSSRRLVNLLDPSDPQDAATKAYVDATVITDHGQLGGLGDDDHGQYALLAGRVGGQALHGGSADGEDLLLRSTSGSSFGHVWLADRGPEPATLGWKDQESTIGKVFVGVSQSDGWRYGVKVQFTGDGAAVTYPDAVKAEATLGGSQAVDGRGHTGVAGFCQLDNDFSEPNSEGRGGVFAFVTGSSASSATLGLAVGARCGVDVASGNTVNVVHSVEAKLQAWDTATVGEAALLWAASPHFDSGTSCTTLSGLLVDDLGGHPANVHAIQVAAQAGASAAKGNVYLAGGGWNTGHLRLGDGHLWTSGGSWRFSTAEPASDTDYAFAVGATLDAANRRIENVTDPVNAQDAATKAYVDANAGGVTDHGALTGLGDDDHSQYALLAGRSGGQHLHGGSGASEVLHLSGTSHATAGTIRLEDNAAGRVVFGDEEYDPAWSSNQAACGRFMAWAEDGDFTSTAFVGQRTAQSGSDAVSLLVSQEVTGDPQGAALRAREIGASSADVTLLRGVAGEVVATGGSTAVTISEARAVEALLDIGGQYAVSTGTCFLARLKADSSERVDTFRAFSVPSLEITAAGAKAVVGLHVGDIGVAARDSCDAILVDAQDDGFDGLSGNIRMAGGDWNTGHLQLGVAHIWASSGDLKFSRSTPSSASDCDVSIGYSSVNVHGKRITELSDPVSATDAVTKSYVDSATASLLSSAYTAVTDGTSTASASGSDTFKLRSANDRLSIQVTDDDATHGDNALFTLNEGNIVHQNLSGAGAHPHSDLDTHLDSASGVHGVTGSVVGTTDTQTLSNKTLAAPSISDASMSGSTSLSGTADVSADATFTGRVDAGDATALEVPSAANVTLANTGEVAVNTTSGTLNFHDGTGKKVLSPLRRFSVTIESPSDSENITLTHMDENSLVRKVVVVLQGSSSPSVTFNVYHSTNRSDSPSFARHLFSSDQVASSVTSGDSWDSASFDRDDVAPGSFMWLVTSGVSGTVTEMSITVYYTQEV